MRWLRKGLKRAGTTGAAPCVSYLLNQLQPLPVSTPVVVTLNPSEPPAPELEYQRFEYEHPVFDQPAIDANIGSLAEFAIHRDQVAAIEPAQFGDRKRRFAKDDVERNFDVVDQSGGKIGLQRIGSLIFRCRFYHWAAALSI